MKSERELENIVRKLEYLAKKHHTEVDVKLDGSHVAAVRLESKKGGGVKAVVGVRNFRKALTSPALLKAALSMIALKGAGGGKIDVEFESGMIKRLFGKN